MKQHAPEAIVAFCRAEVWPKEAAYGLDDFRVSATVEPRLVQIKVARMYEAPGLSFAQLEKLAQFFGTKNVETDSEFHSSGCETCDYGSEYGFYLYVRPGDAP